jgi:Tfp pilus assembly protein PilF
MRRLLPLALLALLSMPALAAEDADEVSRKAMDLYTAGKYEQALPLFKRALEATKARYGENSPLLALDLNNLAEVYRQLGRAADAEPLYKRAIQLDEQAGADNPDLASDLNNLALLYRGQGRNKEAEALYSRAVAVLERTLGPEHPNVAKTLNNLAILYRTEGQPDRARPLAERALAVAEKSLGPDDAMTRQLRANLEQLGGPSAPAGQAVAAAEPPAAAPAKAGLPVAKKPGLAIPSPSGTLPPPAELTSPVRVAAKPAAARPVPAPVAVDGGPHLVESASPAPAPAPTSAATAPSPPSVGRGAGRFAIHVASVRDPAAVSKEWQRMAERFPALAGLGLRSPTPVAIPGKGTFYRVAGGAFATHDEAQAACDRLRAAGQYCEVTAP